MKKGTYEDQIRIEELEVYAHHGVYPEENEKGQHFYVIYEYPSGRTGG